MTSTFPEIITKTSFSLLDGKRVSKTLAISNSIIRSQTIERKIYQSLDSPFEFSEVTGDIKARNCFKTKTSKVVFGEIT